MKNQINPTVFVSILVVALLLVGVFAWKVWSGPSSVASPEAAKGAVNPRAGGGPDAAALQYRDEYNKTHPNAGGSR